MKERMTVYLDILLIRTLKKNAIASGKTLSEYIEGLLSKVKHA